MPTTTAFAIWLTLAAFPGDPAPRSLAEELHVEELRLDQGAPAPAGPESLPLYPSLYRRLELKLGGGIFGNFDTALTVSSDVLVGAKLDLEDTLGIDDSKSVLRFDANYAFSPRHELRLGAFDIDRSGTRAISEDLDIGEVTIPAGSLDTSFGTTVVKLAYLYNFVSEHRTQLGVSAGLHTMTIDASFESSIGSVSETFDAIAPLPVFGLHGEYALSRRWRMLGSVELFQIDIGEASGHLTDTQLAFEHDLFEHVGWGVALNGFAMDAELEGDGPLDADLVYQYQGLLVYLRAYW